MSHFPLIAPKPLADFSADEFHTYISDMKNMGERKESVAPGLSVRRNAKGTIVITRSKKSRFFNYVTNEEISALAKQGGFTQAELWNQFKAKKYIIAGDRLEAEEINSTIAEIPF